MDFESTDYSSEDWISKFIAQHPEGTPEDFEAWAKKQPELIADADSLGRVRQALEDWRRSADLLRLFVRPEERGAGPAQNDPESSIHASERRLTPGAVVGHFHLRSFLARGGMGQVWVAHDTELRRDVALKLILPDRVDLRSQEYFAREARAGGRLNHPNIVTTLSYGSHDGLTWIAQELVEGSWTLKDFLDEVRSGDRIPQGYYARVAELVAQVADALQSAHDAGVIHRDVKPANILLGPQGVPLLTDFGLARVRDDSMNSATGEFAGTWYYMSPEQVTAKRMGLDHRSDVFSLGVVLYELLSLTRPFEGDTTHQIAERIITHDPPSASRVRSQCPQELALICGKALEKSPGRRYQSAGDFAADLRAHLDNRPIAARPPSPITKGVKWARRNPTLTSVAASLAIIVGLCMALLAIDLKAARELARATAESAKKGEEIQRLSTLEALEQLESEALALWPATPAIAPRLQAWIERAQLIVDARPDFYEQLASLVGASRADSLLSADQEPEGSGLLVPSLAQQLRARADLLEDSIERRIAGTPIERPTLDWSQVPSDAQGLKRMAYRLGTLDRKFHGSEALGLVLAERAVEIGTGEDRIDALDAVARIKLLLGDLDGAIADANAAEEGASEEWREFQEKSAKWVLAQAEELRSPERIEADKAELLELREKIRLEEAKSSPDTPQAGAWDPQRIDEAWWAGQLVELIRGIDLLEESQLRQEAITPELGWSVARRLQIAQAEPRSDWEAAWSEALPEIGLVYDGLDMAPAFGLMPLGPDPESGMWEFADLSTGEPATRGPDGRLIMTADSSLVWVLLPGGEFTMGAQDEDPAAIHFDEMAQDNEWPPHTVELSPFLISKFEMTQGQWMALTSANPSYVHEGNWIQNWPRERAAWSALHPVESISWTTARETLRRIGADLPTEAQWEYAARAGSDSVYWSGDDPCSLEGKSNLADTWAQTKAGPAWGRYQTCIDDGHFVHAPVGSFEANPFGLHDVHGNVSEWTRDSTTGMAYMFSGVLDPCYFPLGSKTANARGGSFANADSELRSAARGTASIDYVEYDLGLRPARAVALEVR
ncbi:MAG: bifunctional serine/threonine-protein kinase/formylglycine-generating enzyme family protein [Planctomycetota bacterium]|jgi:serine/threonine protein kinase/formylglycine-generating enzyme required for sulfatase activity